MSINNTNSLSIVKNVSQHRFLNSNLASNLSTTANSNNSSNSSSTTVNQRRLPKSLSNYSSSNISLNTYSNSNNNNSNLFNSNSNNSQPQPQTQSTYLPSMLKNTPTFQTNKKYSADYNQAIKFDYADVFVNNHNIEFLNRVSQMQRLQIDTVEWERKKRLQKRRPNNATTTINGLASNTPSTTSNYSTSNNNTKSNNTANLSNANTTTSTSTLFTNTNLNND